jgi:uncharacterized protein DUF6916
VLLRLTRGGSLVEWYGAPGSVRDLQTLTLDDFAALKGERFRMASGGAPPFDAELVEVNELAREGASPARAPFSLVFQTPPTPPTPPVPQGIHRVEHDALGAVEIFLVPVGPDRYEAVFT